jgi:hypothetical protein
MNKKLGDGKVYKFQTLSRLELSSYSKLLSNKGNRELEKLQLKMEGDGLDENEFEQFEKLQQDRLNKVNQLIRVSLGKNHAEFALTNDPTKEHELNTKLDGLIDIRDTTQIIEFITTGTITQPKEIIVPDSEITI